MKISIQEIEKMIANDRTDAWREVLKEGYEPDEYYFEFGVYPKFLKDYDNFEIIANHSYHIWLRRVNETGSSSSVITSNTQNNQRAGQYMVCSYPTSAVYY